MTKEEFMQRCFELAEKGFGRVSPNPMVGSVIVYENQIIGEGYHQQFGQPHAEVNAVNNVLLNFGRKGSDLLKKSIVYVNLEPCSHSGKTPPCADFLIKQQVKKVIIANIDPYADVNGKGIEKLKQAGIKVEVGLLSDAAWWLNRRFFTRITQQRPYIILKWAQTANDFFAPKQTRQQWISGEDAKLMSHKWRGEEDAILVGKKTALADNPRLTNRVGGKNPIRILIDKNLEILPSANIYDNESKTIIFNEIKTEVVDNIHFIKIEDMHFYLPQKIAYQLYLTDIQSLIIEGGANILSQFISANLWDEARIFTSVNGFNQGLAAPMLSGEIIQQIKLKTDTLTIYKRN